MSCFHFSKLISRNMNFNQGKFKSRFCEDSNFKNKFSKFFASQQFWLMLMLQYMQTSPKLNSKRQGETWKKTLDGIEIGIVFTKIEMLIQHSTEMKRSIRKNLMQTCQKKPNSTLNKWTLHIWLQSSWKVHWTKNKYANKNASVAITACFDSAF